MSITDGPTYLIDAETAALTRLEDLESHFGDRESVCTFIDDDTIFCALMKGHSIQYLGYSLSSRSVTVFAGKDGKTPPLNYYGSKVGLSRLSDRLVLWVDPAGYTLIDMKTAKAFFIEELPVSDGYTFFGVPGDRGVVIFTWGLSAAIKGYLDMETGEYYPLNYHFAQPLHSIGQTADTAFGVKTGVMWDQWTWFELKQ